jgi:hypothetical protein
MEIPDLLDAAPCIVVDNYRNFGEMCYLHCDLLHHSTHNTEAELSLESSVKIYQTTQRHIPEDRDLHSQRRMLH